jgi:hypothetical protein
LTYGAIRAVEEGPPDGRVLLENLKVTRCQKCKKAPRRLAHLEKVHALLWERRDGCPGAVPVLVCHDEVVVECDVEQAGEVKAWLDRAMIEGMEAALNGTDEVDVPVEVEARIVRSWSEGG